MTKSKCYVFFFQICRPVLVGVLEDADNFYQPFMGSTIRRWCSEKLAFDDWKMVGKMADCVYWKKWPTSDRFCIYVQYVAYYARVCLYLVYLYLYSWFCSSIEILIVTYLRVEVYWWRVISERMRRNLFLMRKLLGIIDSGDRIIKSLSYITCVLKFSYAMPSWNWFSIVSFWASCLHLAFLNWTKYFRIPIYIIYASIYYVLLFLFFCRYALAILESTHLNVARFHF